ncbi:MAG TPA: hypothetical protein VLK65_06690 [Vicinamibacteria bacterium]|nr:hypothetical protein [Vicinamibacteria bacterium]
MFGRRFLKQQGRMFVRASSTSSAPMLDGRIVGFEGADSLEFELRPTAKANFFVANRPRIEFNRTGGLPNNGIEQTNSEPHSMTPFAAHPKRYLDKSLHLTTVTS